MQKNLKYLLILIMVSFACQSKPTQTEEVAAVLPEHFKRFYEDFHSDSIFQMAHIHFPLKAQQSYRDSSSILTIDTIYTEQTWTLHKPFIQDSGFEREFRVLGDLVTEITKDNMGLLSIERRWGVLDSSWYLIYYHTTRNQW